MCASDPKEPVLIFSGGDDGVIRKWERLQLNTFMYSQESLSLPKEDVPEAEVSKADGRRGRKKKMTFFEKHKALMEKREQENLAPIGKKVLRPGVVSMCYYEELDLLISGYEDSKISMSS